MHHFEGGRLPPRPSRARPTPSAGSTPQRPRPPSSPEHCGGDNLARRVLQPCSHGYSRAAKVGACPTHHFYNRTCRSSKTFLVIMFASSGISHANTITSLKCLLCETPPLRKETREGLCYVLLPPRTCAGRFLLSPRDVLVPSGFTNLGFSFEPLRPSLTVVNPAKAAGQHLARQCLVRMVPEWGSPPSFRRKGP